MQFDIAREWIQWVIFVWEDYQGESFKKDEGPTEKKVARPADAV
jgi:hypothetical protein